MSYALPCHGGAGGIIQSAANACGSSYPSSFNSFELPAITPSLLPQPDFYVAAAAAQTNDFFYYSSRPRYAESPLTSAELYGAGARSVSPVMGCGSTPFMGSINGYGYMDQAAGSVFSSCSVSGSRFPQWYLPRGYCPISCSNAVGASCGSGCGLYADCASTGITPTPVSMEQNSTEEEMLSGSHGQSHSAVVPPPPRLSPQSTSGTLAPFALPPPYAATAAGNGVHASSVPPTYPSGVMELPSSASSITSPASRTARTPQFLPYDGRAYDIPPRWAPISSAAAAAAVAHCPLVACAQRGGYSPVDAAQPIRMSARKSSTPHDMQGHPSMSSPLTQRARPYGHRMSTGSAGTVSESAERSCSLEEGALLADVHARLVQHHRSSQRLKECSSMQRVGVKPLSHPDFTVPAKASALGKKVDISSSNYNGACMGSMAPEEAAVAALSPIPRLPAAGDVDVETSEQSLWEGEEAVAQPPTQDALDRVLMIPGVVWRHDPYSRIVLPKTQATVESDSSEATSTSFSSLPAKSPYAAQAALGFSDRGDATASVTQPPRSPDIFAGPNDGSSNSADGLQPSPRRLPTKKVCVRHYVNGDDELSLSHERSGVGALLSVREAPTATVPVVLFSSSASASLRHSAFMDDDDDGAIPAAPPETGSTAMRTVKAPASAVCGKPSVPKPRSKQMGLSAPARGKKAGTTKEVSVGSTDFSSSVSCASGHLKTSDLTSSSTLVAVSTVEAPGNEDVSMASGIVGSSADPAAGAVMWQAVRRPSVSSSPLDVSVARTAYQSASRWVWRPRSARVHPLEQPGEMASRKEELLVSTLADLDTSDLLRLWQKLDSSGCFRDALELRRCVIGPGSNSSTRVLRRMLPLSRRLINRRRGLEVESGDGPRFTVLDESEMKYVCLLQHRFRKSTAVASEHYTPGTMVVVDGDMGVDTGIVTLSITRDEYEAMSDVQRRAAHLVVHLEFSLAASIHRAARTDEILMHDNTQRPLEEATLEFLRYLTTQPHLFESCRVEWMHFVDVEFQADGQKLYVHYTSETPVRFLELATFLNHIFHCRIWMKVVKEEDC
ncbi:hypothetical protein, conserved [Leishmania tarentolae]|uniref:PSP1 C-terminal domain-containing protein n=1 Tax=Leishmania tarentolae TaxID=5689 RepID=A0A640KM22_LEITA|nr:hypothetical protein, conserved [Leishmania tarentolae]